MAGKNKYQVIIVGAGIAGASMAYALSRRGFTDVLILEREFQPGYHATGRSAASLVTLDVVWATMKLTQLARPFFENPPEGFCEHDLLDPTGVLGLFDAPMWEPMQMAAPALEAEGARLELLDAAEIHRRLPHLAPGWFQGGVWLPEDGRLDVNELLWGYLRQARRAGAELCCDTEVTGVVADKGRVRAVVTEGGEIGCETLVCAAGAWAQRLGKMAGAAPIALTPHLRTVVSFAAPEGTDCRRWPLTGNESHPFYIAPDGDGLMASPADEEPCEPKDARPDEMGIAVTMDKLEKMAPSLLPRSLRKKWAGLRTFSEDRTVVVGADPLLKGFFWLAGQGGAGIETSPVVSEIAADLLIDGRTDRFDAAMLAPERFSR